MCTCATGSVLLHVIPDRREIYEDEKIVKSESYKVSVIHPQNGQFSSGFLINLSAFEDLKLLGIQCGMSPSADESDGFPN